jgi:hypothetical protein
MSITVAQAAKELERFKHERAVWMETVEHLSKFIDQEVRLAEQGIAATGCVENKVPQSIIKEFILYINEQEIEPLNVKIEEIENLTIVETKNGNQETKEAAGPIRAQVNPPAHEGSKVSTGGKKLRTLSGHPGRKIQSPG